MQKSLHLELRRNRYFLLLCCYSYVVTLAALSLIVMPVWLYLLLLVVVSISFVPTLIGELTGNSIRHLHIFLDRVNRVQISLPGRDQQPVSWKISWRSRRLVVLVFFFGWFRLPASAWISPHSLEQSQQHRQLRLLTRFSQAS